MIVLGGAMLIFMSTKTLKKCENFKKNYVNIKKIVILQPA